MEDIAKDAPIEILLEKLFRLTAEHREEFIYLFKNRLRSGGPDYDKLWEETLRRPESIAWLNEQAARAQKSLEEGRSLTTEEFLAKYD